MAPDTQQIMALAHQGLTPAEIAEALAIDQKAVEFALYQEGAVDFDEDAIKEAAGFLRHVVREGDNETNRTKAAMFIIEVGRGHRVSKQERPNLNLNVLINAITAGNSELNKRLFGAGQAPALEAGSAGHAGQGGAPHSAIPEPTGAGPQAPPEPVVPAQ